MHGVWVLHLFELSVFTRNRSNPRFGSELILLIVGNLLKAWYFLVGNKRKNNISVKGKKVLLNVYSENFIYNWEINVCENRLNDAMITYLI